MVQDKNKEFDFTKALIISLKYIIQGIAIAIVAYYIPLLYKRSLRKPTFNEVFLIATTAALSMYILDNYTTIGPYANLGIGFELGRHVVSGAAFFA